MAPAYCFPLGLYFAPFFSTELVGGKKSKLTFIEHLLCFGVCNPASATGYIIGGCSNFSWQLHIILHLNANSVAYSLEFSSHSASLHLVQLILLSFPEQLITGRHFFLLIWGLR